MGIFYKTQHESNELFQSFPDCSLVWAILTFTWPVSTPCSTTITWSFLQDKSGILCCVSLFHMNKLTVYYSSYHDWILLTYKDFKSYKRESTMKLFLVLQDFQLSRWYSSHGDKYKWVTSPFRVWRFSWKIKPLQYSMELGISDFGELGTLLSRTTLCPCVRGVSFRVFQHFCLFWAFFSLGLFTFWSISLPLKMILKSLPRTQGSTML